MAKTGENSQIEADGLMIDSEVGELGRVLSSDEILDTIPDPESTIDDFFREFCREKLQLLEGERFRQKWGALSNDERIILVHEIHRTFLEHRHRVRRDGSSYFYSHLGGTVDFLIAEEGLVGLASVIAGFKHDNPEDLKDQSVIDEAAKEAGRYFDRAPNIEEAAREAGGYFEKSPRRRPDRSAGARERYIASQVAKAKKAEERRLLAALIDSTEYRHKLSPDFNDDELKKLEQAVRTYVGGMTKIEKARQEATDDATFEKLLEVVKHAVRVAYIKIADRSHNMKTIKGHGDSPKGIAKQRKIIRESEEQYLPLARIFRIRRAVQYYVEKCCRFFNPGLLENFEKLAAERRSKLDSEKVEEVKNILRNQVLADYPQAEIQLVPLDLSCYPASVDKPYSELTLANLKIGEFDPMQEFLITFDSSSDNGYGEALYKLRFKVMEEIYEEIKRHFVPDARRENAPYYSPESIVGMSVFCFDPRFGRLRFRINHKLAEVRSSRGVLADSITMETPDDVKAMIGAILQKGAGDFMGQRSIRAMAKMELLKPLISVKTPGGRTISLPHGSNALDFAAKVHGDLLLHMDGVLMMETVDSMEPGVQVDPFAPLENGKVYFIKTDPSRVRVTQDWLLFANPTAAGVIRNYLARMSGGEIHDGSVYLERLARIFNINVGDLIDIIEKKFTKKPRPVLIDEAGAGVINPVLLLAQYLQDFRDRQVRSAKNTRHIKDLRRAGLPEDVIREQIARRIEDFDKWDVAVLIPEDTGSLSDFANEFTKEAGIKIDWIKVHAPGRHGQPGLLRLVFDLSDAGVNIYTFFVKLIKLSFRWDVKVAMPIEKKLGRSVFVGTRRGLGEGEHDGGVER